ncbi:uncharacterized protein AMSG_05779 [Thecamonas trahens ATCC 50062]|uniref:Uncharacterized protein n=1 Tax=Thecamonas trahens ATCC 50062 TaxID=461836 RepID=A0A0L0DCG1_THETB|nr:hypothetical protein AMSG_05779 [Thecamonas trahens ATCC 50062]KNC50022.1 hypothetical protein AMSG_05779 [Thecamonas trahens ATCC 50062]|eukprot:XP_013757189.1 hypothetical protein AMSG_05779 [Thecamonas trahens ATCC 50062]
MSDLSPSTFSDDFLMGPFTFSASSPPADESDTPTSGSPLPELDFADLLTSSDIDKFLQHPISLESSHSPPTPGEWSLSSDQSSNASSVERTIMAPVILSNLQACWQEDKLKERGDKLFEVFINGVKELDSNEQDKKADTIAKKHGLILEGKGSYWGTSKGSLGSILWNSCESDPNYLSFDDYIDFVLALFLLHCTVLLDPTPTSPPRRKPPKRKNRSHVPGQRVNEQYPWIYDKIVHDKGNLTRKRAKTESPHPQDASTSE